MASDGIDELSKAIQNMTKQHIQDLYDLTESHAKDMQQILDLVLEDMIDSYDLLIQLRQQSIDKYIKFVSILMQDEIDVSKPIQALVEKKMNDVAELKQEIAPIKDFKYLLDNDADNEDEVEKVINRIKNM